MGIRSQNNPIAAYLDVFSRRTLKNVDMTAAPGGSEEYRQLVVLLVITL